MKNLLLYFFLFSLLLLSGCSNYLDIVPDKTQDISLLFQRRQAAYNALATCYHYLPQEDGVYSTYAFASDELTTPVAKETPGVELMRGKQTAANPLMGLWDDTYPSGRTQESLFKAIRCCNTFIENIHLVMDMTDTEKESWKSEAMFLKAYYHFLLFRQYGPIPIVDVNLPITASVNDVRVKRQPVDEVIKYIVSTIDKSIANLPLRITSSNDLGRIDQVIAYSIKSRVLLYAASPLFNGNAEYYDTFVDKDGNKFFNTTYDKEKWKSALDAAETAINLATANGLKMYEYSGAVPTFDSLDYQQPEVKALYNYRYMFVDKWNSELIWGNSSPVNNGDWWSLQAASMMINPAASAQAAAWQWVSPTIQVVEAYYTKNGLPIDEDLTFKYANRYSLARVSDADKYHATTGSTIMIPNLHLGREPRFYASIGFDKGIYRTWGKKWNLEMKKGEIYGRRGNTNDYVITGYVLKKVCHPNSEGDAYSKLIVYPWPLIRLAELYLNYAEAYNEYYGPDQKVYDALNKIRVRSGVPTVEQAWENPLFAKTLNKHKTKDGLRQIIQQERQIELAFEGHRNFDVRRWKEADKYFNRPVTGWSVDGSTTNTFYVVKTVGQRSFITPRDYLHPIKYSEMVVNSNLVQNPGW
ncbi:MAG: RagB/SusD family nutrient uptake outer membrane protein [Bacteroidota bacterium]|nr:RagB/SusD family nutrient uptake outer membrane protein [Bacteroidota bacterium]